MQAEHIRPESKFDPPGGGLGYALMQTANAWRSELAIALAPVSVTPPQFFVLAALLHVQSRARPGPTQKELADRTGIDVNTTSQIVRGLERRGIVRRQPHPQDSRAVALGLTQAGLELARQCTREARALNRRFFAPADAEPLLHTLEELTARSHGRRVR
jgi:MarR family transcriptional regulator, organic hydroperoxide resistance regulator